MNIKTSLLALSCLCTLGSMSGLARAERFIDTFANPLPNETLPGTSTPLPLLWAGTISGASKASDAAYQASLANVLGGYRDVTIMPSQTSNSYYLESLNSSGKHVLSYNTGVGTSGHLVLEYGAEADLNANLSGDGSVAFELEVNGDMDNSVPNRPVQLTVTAWSGGTAAHAAVTTTLIHDGVYQIPFSSFSGVNFADIDYLSFDFDATAVSAVDFDLIGGIRTTRCLQAAGSVVADIMLDTFEDAFPSRVWPGVGTYPILWAGYLNGTLKPSDPASQSGLFGAIGGQRNSLLSTSSTTNFINASMSTLRGTPMLAYATPSATSGTLKLDYGAQADLNADLSLAQAFELEIQGDLDKGASPRPVPLTVSVRSTVGAKHITQSATVTLLHDGMVYVPFSLFPMTNFHDVDRVTFLFDGSGVQAVDYDLIGGVRASACIP
jgi:hypothetical protein